MLEAIIIGGVFVILIILFYPRRSPYVRRVAKSRNGQPWWKEKELY